MAEEIHNVAEVKKHLSEFLGRVAFGNTRILITKRGKPMARLVPVETDDRHLGDAKGWLDDDDVFFDTIERIVSDRSRHHPRCLQSEFEEV